MSVDVAAGSDAAPAADGAAASGTAGAGDGSGNKNKKEQMECGESGSYGDLKKKTGGGQFDRDHVPSKAALKEFARRECNGGDELCPEQKRAVDNIGNAIAIPKSVHSGFSPTYGGRNTQDRINQDAGNLQAAAQRDTKEVEQGMQDPCKKKYQEWAKGVNKMTNNDYKNMLDKAISPFKP